MTAQDRGTPNARVLVVEDDAVDLELTIQAFEAHGLADRVDVARDGHEALTYLRRARATHALPALVVLDLNMPRVDGFEVLQRAHDRAGLRDVPFVVFSTTRRQEERERSLALGAREFRTKPGRFADLLDVVSDWVQRFLPNPDPGPLHPR